MALIIQIRFIQIFRLSEARQISILAFQQIIHLSSGERQESFELLFN